MIKISEHSLFEELAEVSDLLEDRKITPKDFRRNVKDIICKYNLHTKSVYVKYENEIPEV